MKYLLHLVAEPLATPPHRLVAIGWGRNAVPRTYRLVRPPAWPVRLAAALLTTLT